MRLSLHTKKSTVAGPYNCAERFGGAIQLSTMNMACIPRLSKWLPAHTAYLRLWKHNTNLSSPLPSQRWMLRYSYFERCKW